MIWRVWRHRNRSNAIRRSGIRYNLEDIHVRLRRRASTNVAPVQHHGHGGPAQRRERLRLNVPEFHQRYIFRMSTGMSTANQARPKPATATLMAVAPADANE